MKNKVLGPAIAFIAIGVLHVLFAIVGLIAPNDPEEMRELFAETEGLSSDQIDAFVSGMERFGVGFNVLAMIVGALVVIAGARMIQMRGYGLAMTASIVALIPCLSPCCCLGIPFGAWALIVLLDKDVKAAFDQPTTPPPL